MIVPKYYEDLNVLHLNTMPNRAYYIPASVSLDTVGERRIDSDRFVLLNGNWKFRYYESVYDLKEKFYEEDFCAGRLRRDPGAGRSGRIMGMTAISTAISAIHFRWTRLTFLMIIPVALISTVLSMNGGQTPRKRS